MRQYVDAGSNLFVEIMRNVPVLSQKNHSLVSRSVREISLQSMVSTDVTEEEAKEPDYQARLGLDDEEPATGEAATAQGADAAPEKALVSAAIRKRKLYR